jgi:hypothetical protein
VTLSGYCCDSFVSVYKKYRTLRENLRSNLMTIVVVVSVSYVTEYRTLRENLD